MKKNFLPAFISLVCVCVLAVGLLTVPAGADDTRIPEDEISAIVGTSTDASLVTSPFTEAVSKSRDSVVGINNYRTQSYYSYGYGWYGRNGSQSEERLYGTGSGVVISSYGHILTNYHVVEDATRITVTTANDDREHEASLVVSDSDLDIAVLLVKGLDVAPAALGDSDALQVGEWAIVIGNPLGESFARTVTVGIISAVDRTVTDTAYDRYNRRYTISNTMIQTDAAINSGNSGGGMFNVLGQLMGIPARKYSSQMFSADVDNIGMCIPINMAKPLIEEALRAYSGAPQTAAEPGSRGNTETAEAGNDMANKPRLGVTVSTLSSSVTQKLPLGAVVVSVDEGGPAAEAGIRKGDIIVAVNNTNTPSSSAVISQLQDLKEGDVVTVTVYRTEGMAEAVDSGTLDLNAISSDGKYIEIPVTLRIVGSQSSFLPTEDIAG